MEALKRMPFTAQKEIFKRLEEYANTHHLSQKENEAYINSLWIAYDNAAVMEGARIEGREEGRKEGKMEANEETAKRSLALGLSPDQVAQITNLPIERVLGIQRSM